MRTIALTFLCMTMLALCSCIPVSDFGAFWDKGTVDPALVGKWDEIPGKDAPPPEAGKENKSSIEITSDNGAYKIDSLDEEERKKADYAPMAARTLTAGSYAFLMVKEGTDKDGDMIRYKIEGDVFREYTLNDGQMAALLKQKYPGAKNIGKPECKEEKCLFDGLRIEVLDDEVYKILSEIPDTPEFWTAEDKYRRQK